MLIGTPERPYTHAPPEMADEGMPWGAYCRCSRCGRVGCSTNLFDFYGNAGEPLVCGGCCGIDTVSIAHSVAYTKAHIEDCDQLGPGCRGGYVESMGAEVVGEKHVEVRSIPLRMQSGMQPLVEIVVEVDGVRYRKVEGPRQVFRARGGPCQAGQRCTRCLKLAHKLALTDYQRRRRQLLERYGVPQDGGQRVLRDVPLREIESLMRARLKVGKTYRRWKRGSR